MPTIYFFKIMQAIGDYSRMIASYGRITNGSRSSDRKTVQATAIRVRRDELAAVIASYKTRDLMTEWEARYLLNTLAEITCHADKSFPTLKPFAKE